MTPFYQMKAVSPQVQEETLDIGAEEQNLMVVCGWCGSLIRPGHFPVSHGICPSCFGKQRQILQEAVKRGIVARR
ncbi:MAG: hypothetical protein D6820_16365 [Lentisphaerae bacterium]|nr:MAG: hypothetical protein D6820_16365 [Lentisphaerota bacterium]